MSNQDAPKPFEYALSVLRTHHRAKLVERMNQKLLEDYLRPEPQDGGAQ